MATDRLRVEGNERLDLADFQFIAGDSHGAAMRQLLSQFICSSTRERKWVISGFEITNPAGTQVQVAKGKGLFAEYRSGTTYYGVLTTEGDATKTVDINTYASAVYGIYVRFEEVEGSYQPRIFWNPSGLGSEYTETVATRYQANWSVRIETSSPGDEWLQIGTVDRSDMTIVDMRDFFFEGPVDGSYASGWSSDGGGSANDRNADRKTYGIADFQQAFAATRQCLEDIKGRGLRRWWDRSIGGMNIGFDADPVEDRLAVGNSAFYLDGANAALVYDTGDFLGYTRGSNTLNLVLGSAEKYHWDATAYFPETTDALDLGKSAQRFSTLYLGGQARWTRGGAGADEKNWQLHAVDNGGVETLRLSALTDAWGGEQVALAVERATDSATISKVVFPGGFYCEPSTYALSSTDTANSSIGKSAERIKYGYFDQLDATNLIAGTAFKPDTNKGADLGASPDFYFNTTYTAKLSLDTGAGEGVVSNLYPGADGTLHFGTTDRRWVDGYFSDGLYLDRAADGTQFIRMGSGTAADRNWAVEADTSWKLRLYDGSWANPVDAMTVTRSGAAISGVTFGVEVYSTHGFYPTSDGAGALGYTDRRWASGYINNIYVNTLAQLDKIENGGSDISIGDSLVPDADASLACGSSSLRWLSVTAKNLMVNDTTEPRLDFWNGNVNLTADQHNWRLTTSVVDTNYAQLKLAGYTDAGAVNYPILNARWFSGGDRTITIGGGIEYIELVADEVWFNATVQPTNHHSHYLGTSTKAWERVYTHYLYVDDAGSYLNSYDDEDDLSLIDGYTPTEQFAELLQAGKLRQIRQALGNTLPWPMLDEEGKRINISTAFCFLVGAIKQLHQKVKALEAPAI